METFKVRLLLPVERDGRLTREPVDVTLEVDVRRLASILGEKALRSSGRKATSLYNAVTARV